MQADFSGADSDIHLPKHITKDRALTRQEVGLKSVYITDLKPGTCLQNVQTHTCQIIQEKCFVTVKGDFS